MIFINLNHSPEKFIDFIFTITKITTFDIVVSLLTPTSIRCVELEIKKIKIIILYNYNIKYKYYIKYNYLNN